MSIRVDTGQLANHKILTDSQKAGVTPPSVTFATQLEQEQGLLGNVASSPLTTNPSNYTPRVSAVSGAERVLTGNGVDVKSRAVQEVADFARNAAQTSISGAVNLTKDDYRTIVTGTTTITMFAADASNVGYEGIINNPDGYIINIVCQGANTINGSATLEQRFPGFIHWKVDSNNTFTASVTDSFVDKRKYATLMDDFLNITADSTKVFFTNLTGTNTTVFSSGLIGSSQHGTGINPAGRAGWWLSNTAISNLTTKNTILEIGFLIGTLPTALQDYTLRLGLIDSNTGESFNGCYLRLSSISPNFVCVNRAAGSSQTSTTSVVALASQPYTLRIEANSFGVRYYIAQYGQPFVQIAFLNAALNIPTGNMIPGLLIAKSSGGTPSTVITDSFTYIRPISR